jgi:GT2 family glycosyltransferase
MISNPHVTIIVVNWNGRHQLEPCLSALRAQTYPAREIIVVDNGSTDGSVEYMAAHFPEVRVISVQTNRGFAVANNIAIRASTSDYVALINNDAEADADWLANMIAVAEADQSIGMVACKMLFADRPAIINSTGVCVDRAGIAWDRAGGQPDTNPAADPLEIFGPCAGAALYRRSMLDAIGLFDEEFFMYLEDVDLDWRARRAGWRCYYVPSARVLHHHSASAGEGSPFKSFQLGRNKLWLIVKNYPFRALWRYVPLVIAYDVAAVAYALVARRDIHAWRGRMAALAGLRHMWQKRSRDTARQDVLWLLPLTAPWRVAQRYQHLKARRSRD